MTPVLPSAKDTSDCLEGTDGACVRMLGWTLMRAATMAAGMAAAGERDHLWKKVQAGSLGVQAWMLLETRMRNGQGMVSSSIAALDGSPAGILVTWLGRSLLVWTSLQLTGQGRNAWRNALAGAAAIEVAVLMWAKENRA